MKNLFKKLRLKYPLYFILWIIIFSIWVNFYVIKSSENYVFSEIKNLENKQVWLVLWASAKLNFPSITLQDRLDSSIEAFKKWKFEIFLLSWDHWKKNYDEVNTMKNYLLKKGISKEKIFLDHAGFDTYDSLYRAKNIFWAKSLVIFTQKFHLYRAVYIWNWLWINSIWYISDKRKYLKENYNSRREFLARIKAFLEVEIFHTQSKFLWKKINLNWSYLETWD